MKRILLVAFLSFLIIIPGFSQNNTLIGLYGGAGCATSNNYNVAPSVGFEFLKGVAYSRAHLGADLFYQTYSLYYDNEQNSAKHGTGLAGVIDRNATSYVFLAPKVQFGLSSSMRSMVYLTVGVGFKVGGFDSLRKWDHSYTAGSINNYDSSLDASKNINSMLLRIGVGFTQYLQISYHWSFTFTEDFGFLPASLSKTSDIDAAGRTQYFPQKLNPGYISLQIGIAHNSQYRIKTYRNKHKNPLL